MSDQGPPEPSKSPRPTRERSLSLPKCFVSRGVAPKAQVGTDRPLGESFPVVIAVAFCALGVCLSVLATRRVTAALQPPPLRLAPIFSTPRGGAS